MSTTQTDSVTLLSAAVRELRNYFTFLGRSDIISSMISASTGDEAAILTLATAGMGTEVQSTDVPADVIENLVALLLDNSEGAYFVADLLSGDRLERFDVDSAVEGVQYEGLESHIKIYFEPDEIAESGQMSFLSDKSIRETVRISKYENNEPTDPESFDSVYVNVAGNCRSPTRYGFSTLAAFEFPNLRLGLPTRNAPAVALFANAIPTQEMSRCVPFLDIKFQSVVPPILGLRTRQLSILRFLGMNNADNDKAGLRDALPLPLSTQFAGFTYTDASTESDELFDTSVSSAGMELFTSPQTMVNANINSFDGDGNAYGGTAGRVLDPFVPLATLDSFKVTMAGTGRGLLANRTALLTFTLHDRSRMADIAPILAADLFAATYLVVEYGWSHPDGGPASDNAFGKMLNAMRDVHTFNIVASNFSIQNDGQVKVTVRLASRGGADAQSIPLATGNVIPLNMFKPMITSYLSKKMREDREVTDEQQTDISKKININLNNATSPSSVISRQLYDKFLEVIRPQAETNDEDGVEVDPGPLAELMDELVGSDGAGGELSETENTLMLELDKKLEALTGDFGEEEIIDPFIAEDKTLAEEDREGVEGSETENVRYVSLGKLFCNFVGYPLAASGRYDEVQMMFYRFNGQAAAARGLSSIAQFKVNIEKFKRWMYAYVERYPGMSIHGFMSEFNTQHVNNPGSINYGLTELYSMRSTTAGLEVSEKTTTSEEEKQEALKAIDDAISAKIVSLYKEDGLGGTSDFVVPDIRVLTETLPAFEVTSGGTGPSVTKGRRKIILKVHVFDSNATPYGDELFLLAAMSDSEIAAKVKDAAGSPAIPNGYSSGVMSAAAEEGAIQEQGAGENDTDYVPYTSSISAREIKKIIKSMTPSFTFGSQYSALSNISLSSTTGGAVGNALLLNALLDDDDPSMLQGKSSDLEDIKLIPASMNVSMIGCPLIAYGQQFFVDMGTGTTADNLYTVTDISHTISAGKFDTSFKLTYCSNGTISTFRSKIAQALPRIKELTSTTT